MGILLYILAGNYSLTAVNLRNQWTKTEENEQESDNFFSLCMYYTLCCI